MKIYLGNKDNENVYEDLNTLNNVLLAGGPGGGKTVYFSRLLKELTSEYSPDDLRFVIYQNEFNVFVYLCIAIPYFFLFVVFNDSMHHF